MKQFLAIVVLAATMSACGLKGPLYMPGQSPKKPTWPPPAQTSPPDPAPVPSTPPQGPDTPASSDGSK